MSYQFSLEITTCDLTGEVLACYFQIRSGKIHETREFEGGIAIADYDKNGYLLGVELIAPCKVTIVNSIAANESPEVQRRTKAFMKSSGPRSMIAA